MSVKKKEGKRPHHQAVRSSVPAKHCEDTAAGPTFGARLPSASSHGLGIEGMERVNDWITKRVRRRDDCKSYTLIIDPTMIESHKREVQMTYLGFKVTTPLARPLERVSNGRRRWYQWPTRSP